ncbi:MAG: thioredoxin domain-containing protein [Acidobacteriaceae bacterium]|nr:thioredoxin domain-containing protein [Acidobacteriaceae bacterium]
MTFLLCFGTIAEQCRPAEKLDTPKVENLLKIWYRLPTNQRFTLVDSSTVDSACYRKLVFRASVPAPLLTLYLTPDGKHLVTSVMDLEVDPAVARRKKQDAVQQVLSSGALLTSGPGSAPLKLVVFSDFQCPYCKRFAGFMNELTPEERSQLQITYRQFPLNIHSWAQDAPALAACVALQDKAAFWKLHDYFFSEQQELSKETLTPKALEFLAQTTSVDTAKISGCIASKSYRESLQGDERLAADLGIRSTPTVFLNGQPIRVASLQDLRTAMHTAMEEAVLARPGKRD